MSLFGKAPSSAGNKLEMTPSTAASSLPPSPFFAPSSRTQGTVLRQVSTPGGSRKLRRERDATETKSTVAGASFNLINTIVGAGIVGIPFAVKEAGLVSGVVMVVLCAAMTVKSLRILIETAKHIDVPSYETLCEAAFGRFGFLFISMAMFVNAYGAMISYLMIVKATLPMLLGVAPDDEPMKRAVLTVSSMIVMLPLCMQRDMAALAKTSIISVCFDCIMVGIVAAKSPIQDTISDAGGFDKVVRSSTYRPNTFFIGLGVLSFAFVCQHGAFIIAGSLKRPTKKRWARVCVSALTTCGVLATTCGTLGYLGYLEQTDGNILNNLGSNPPGRIARGLMCCAMFFVYPMESFVARHVAVVVMFKGRMAHEGDDHAVLARADRRIALTLSLYLLSLVPALLFDDLGNVLAVSGSIGGSSLSYLGPGACYLAIHGDTFLSMAKRRWGYKFTKRGEVGEPAAAATAGANKSALSSKTSTPVVAKTASSQAAASSLPSGAAAATKNGSATAAAVVPPPPSISPTGLRRLTDEAIWHFLFMPLWCAIASIGQRYLEVHEEEEALKTPHINRLGKVVHHRPVHGVPTAKAVAGRGLHGRVIPPTSAGGGGSATYSPYRPLTDDYLDEERGNVSASELTPLVRHDSFPAGGIGRGAGMRTAGTFDPSRYGESLGGAGGRGGTAGTVLPVGNRGIAAAIAGSKKNEGGGGSGSDDDLEEEDDPQDVPPTVRDFVIAIVYVIFGVVAMFAGLGSIYMASAPVGGRRLVMKYV